MYFVCANLYYVYYPLSMNDCIGKELLYGKLYYTKQVIWNKNWNVGWTIKIK